MRKLPWDFPPVGVALIAVSPLSGGDDLSVASEEDPGAARANGGEPATVPGAGAPSAVKLAF